MGRIFLSAGHFLSSAGRSGDPGATPFGRTGTTEAKEVIKTRTAIEKIFDNQGIEYLSVPDHLTLPETIRWINVRSEGGDVAVELHCNAFNGTVQGAEAFYIDGNSQRKQDTKLLLKALLDEVPELKSRGAKSDTLSQHGGLGFCRQVDIPSILVELCFIDNQEDLALLQNHRDRFAQGLAKGLIAWSGQEVDIKPEFPKINIRLNGQNLSQVGILVNHNSYIPIDLAEQLGIDASQLNSALKVRHGNIVYVKAVELNQFGIAIDWEANSKTLILNLSPRENLEDAEKIMGVGKTSQKQLEDYLNNLDSEALQKLPEIAKLYIEEAEKEGINHDIAFAQMCLETGNLQFGNQVKEDQNNFCGLGAVDGGGEGASFDSPRDGVKACIQHLKGYGSTQPITHEPIIDPRFDLVSRGAALTVHDLAGRWASDPEYGEKIMTIVKRINQVF